jgi:hypothetical protein
MTEEQILAVAIGNHLTPSTDGFGEGEAIPEPYEVLGLPAWADIKIYNTAGWRWHFSACIIGRASRLDQKAGIYCPSPGQTFASAAEAIEAVRNYLRAQDV